MARELRLSETALRNSVVAAEVETGEGGGIDQLIPRRCVRVNCGGRPRILSVETVEAVLVEVVDHFAYPVGEVNATLAVIATSIPCAPTATPSERCQRTTDPESRLAMRNSR